MKAVQLKDYGAVENLEVVEVEKPSVGPGQVLVKVEFGGLRWGDIMQRNGYPSRDMPTPFIAGQELAGTIEEVGEGVTGHAVGDPVIGLVLTGGFAEYAVVDAMRLIPVPREVPLGTALAYPVNLRTAWFMVFPWAKVKEGETVLIHAAAGGVGMMATQILKRKFSDVTVIGLASTDEKCAAGLANGCDHMINYKKRDYVEAVLEIVGPRTHPFDFTTNGGGVDVIFNGVSGDTLGKDANLFRRHGRWVIYGWAGGQGQIDTGPAGYLGVTVMPYSTLAWTFTDEDRQSQEFVRDWLLNEELVEPVVYPLDEARQAQEDLENGRTSGKVVLKV
ncbi:MAG: zinc-binding dehydrogenase [Novosphingobium sp.]|nr:zinc-binding dehydrogenase [Novosphingobium sp.]